MGNRIKGRVKKKSIKAAISSTIGSKRKLSRMGKKQKKDHRGLDATYIGRSKCINILQVSLKDFRRLCILKGIYPREPSKIPKNKKGQSFYHIKDIRSIAHEPILQKFRDMKAFMKKVRKASGRNEIDEANRRHSILPKYTLHHIVKERYPRFIDAIQNDLDDCLTLTYLYATLPSDQNNNILPSSKYIIKAKQLVAAWGAYCATTNSITKQFISIKGIYMEASIHSSNTISNIRWIIPHAFTQFIPDDVDFRIMNTFFELYQVLLDFVLHKLYNDIGVRYPLVPSASTSAVGTTSSILGTHLIALSNALDNASSGGTISQVVATSVQQQQSQQVDDKNNIKNKKVEETESLLAAKERIKSIGSTLKNLSNQKDKDNGMDEDDDDDDDDDDDVDISGPFKEALDSIGHEEDITFNRNENGNDDDVTQRKRLFQGYTFFISREVPRGYIELICLAYGAKAIGWEHGNDSPISIKDPSITHHIIDRPSIPVSYESTLPKSREYIQPQWIFDCSNFLILLPIHKYQVGVTLPPHLSPWYDTEENNDGYKPAYLEEIERYKNGDFTIMTDDNNNNDSNKKRKMNDMTIVEEVDEDVDDDSDEESKEEVASNKEEEEVEIDEEEEEEVDDEELEKRQERKRKKIQDEEYELAKSMMSRKAAHLYGRMQHGISQKKMEVDKLKQRRQELEDGVSSSKAANREIIKGKEKKKKGDKNNNNEPDDGKTVLKQKVERLRKERKAIETQYDKTGGSMKKNKKQK